MLSFPRDFHIQLFRVEALNSNNELDSSDYTSYWEPVHTFGGDLLEYDASTRVADISLSIGSSFVHQPEHMYVEESARDTDLYTLMYVSNAR
jgi:hypothetical protein